MPGGQLEAMATMLDQSMNGRQSDLAVKPILMRSVRTCCSSVVLVVFLLSLMCGFPLALSAAEETSAAKASDAEINALIDLAKKKGVEVIVVSPARKLEPKTQDASRRLDGLHQQISHFEMGLSTLLGQVPRLPERVSAALARASPSGSPGHFGFVVLIVLGLMVIAAIVERLYRRWLARWMAVTWPDPPRDKAAKLSFLLWRFVGLRIPGTSGQ